MATVSMPGPAPSARPEDRPLTEPRPRTSRHLLGTRAPREHPRPGWLPGLESVAPAEPDTGWLQDFLFNPHSADILGYLRAARASGGPVLDLGSGAGRLAVPLAHHGFQVEAVDREASCLSRLRDWAVRGGPRTRKAVLTTRADLTDLRLERDYGFVMLAGAMIAAIPPDARPTLLTEIATHLHEGGTLALDFTSHRRGDLAAEPSRSWVFQVPRVGAADELVIARQHFDPDGMREEVTYYTRSPGPDGGLRRVLATRKWIVDPEQLSADLRAAGLRITLRDSRPLDDRTESVFLLCRARG